MAKLIKLRYLILALLAVAVIVSATAFSVSYAKWTGGENTLSITASTGKWAKDLSKLTDEQIQKAITDEINKDPTGANNLKNYPTNYAGILISKKDGETVAASAWGENKGSFLNPFNNGYTTDPLKLEVGDTFVIVLFNRVWVKDKTVNSTGKCKFANGIVNTQSEYDIELGSDKKVFTVKKPCTVTIDMREGGSLKRDDILTITGATIHYPQ